MCLIAVNPMRAVVSRAWSRKFAMRASASTRSSGFDVTCREIATKLRRELSARLCLVDVIMKSLRMQLAGYSVDVGASVRTNGLLGVVTAVDRRRIQTTTCRDVSLREERTTSRRLCTV